MVTTVDDDVRLFIESVANTPLKKELILLLHDNLIVDTCRGLATWINRDEGEIREAVEELVQAGLFERIGEGEDAIYQYAPTPELSPLAEKFIASYRTARDLFRDYLTELQTTIQQIQRASLREVRLERSKLKSIITSMPVGVIVVDASGEIVLYNPVAATLMHWQNYDSTGHLITAVLADTLYQPILDAFERVLAEGNLIISREIELPEPHAMWLSAIITPVYGEGNTMLGAVAVLRDITELKQLDQLRTDFIMSISHDIRSPLTAIKGFAASLLRGSFGELDKQQSHAVEVILQQSERLMEMVEQLTCATHAFPSRVALQLERIDIREVVDECATAYKGISTSRGIALHTDMPSEPVLADVDRNALSRIIANLLDNAIKYTPSQGSVTLRVRSNPNFAIVEVSDTGIGIPPEHLGKIFAPFYRGAHHPEDSEVRGLGLGLSITKNLVEAHGGTIDVESKLGHGTTFRIMLPRHGRERLESVDEGGGSSVNTN